MVVGSSLDPDGDIDSHHIRNLQEKKNVLINLNMFNKYYIAVLRNHFADFNGRATREEFWYYFLFNVVISTGLGLIGGLIGFDWLSSIYSLAVFVPTLALAVRRLHDIGKSGWWYCVVFIPLAGFIWLIILWAKEGMHGPNAYGVDPRA
jgi:uncharacterized membrane protein YhaH (DUF805 family)